MKDIWVWFDRCFYCWKLRETKTLLLSWCLRENRLELESVNLTCIWPITVPVWAIKGLTRQSISIASLSCQQSAWEDLKNVDKDQLVLSSTDCTHSRRALRNDLILPWSLNTVYALSLLPRKLMYTPLQCAGGILPCTEPQEKTHCSQHEDESREKTSVNLWIKRMLRGKEEKKQRDKPSQPLQEKLFGQSLFLAEHQAGCSLTSP